VSGDRRSGWSRLIGDQEVVQISRGTSSTSGSGHSSSTVPPSRAARPLAAGRCCRRSRMSIPGASRQSRHLPATYLLRRGRAASSGHHAGG
jgi:hypothetical protein